jgi:ACS family tartrate transporter-like MFS transporter
LPSRPAEAELLTPQEKEWIQAELLREEHQKLEQHHCSVFQTMANGRVWHLAAIEFGVCIGLYTLSFWAPRLLKSVSGQRSNSAVGILVMTPHLVGILAIVLVSRSSDRHLERRSTFVRKISCKHSHKSVI